MGPLQPDVWVRPSILICSLPRVYVAFPAIAQKQVNESTLEFKTLKLTSPTAHSFHLHQDQVLHSTSTYHPHLDAFNASLFLESTEPNIKPFAYVQVPATQALSSADITIDQTVEIADMDQFVQYSKLVMNSESYRLAVRGRPILREMAYPAIHVDYNQVITLKGMLSTRLATNPFLCPSLTPSLGLNGLKGFSVTKFKILLAPNPDGSNMIGTVRIPNPSIMTIEMGNVTLNLYIAGDFVGTTLIEKLTLNPGDNLLEMKSTTDQTKVISKLLNFKDGILPIDVIGNSSVFNGQHLTYYEESLKSNTQRIELNVGSALKNGGTWP